MIHVRGIVSHRQQLPNKLPPAMLYRNLHAEPPKIDLSGIMAAFDGLSGLRCIVISFGIVTLKFAARTTFATICSQFAEA